jgi:hypothetical protein
MKASRLLITALLCLLLPSVAIATTIRDPTAKLARKHKPRHKHYVVRHHPRRHRSAHTYVYTFTLSEVGTDVGNCTTTPYTYETNVAGETGNAIALLNGYPRVTILFQPRETMFRVTNQPGDPNNAQFVHTVCDFPAPNGDQNCVVYASATYRTTSPARSLSQLMSRPAYSITGVVGNNMGPYLCGSNYGQ